MKRSIAMATQIPLAHVSSNKRIGHHVSMAKGISNAIVNASNIGATAFSLFVRSPRTWKSTPIGDQEIEKWNKLMDTSLMTPEAENKQSLEFKYSFDHILPHGSYLANLGNSDSEKRLKSLELFKEELQICNSLGIKMLNIHPGSTRKEITKDKCIELIAQSINTAFEDVANVKVVLENTAGGGGTIGQTFEEIRDLIALITNKNRVGVCLDTCHMFAAGYDIRTKRKFDAVMQSFDEIVGFKYLCGMHLNDSKSDLGSKLDRHEKLGKGKIGLECFRVLMNDTRFDGIPLILETPMGGQKEEIELLYSLEGKEALPIDIEAIANSIKL